MTVMIGVKVILASTCSQSKQPRNSLDDRAKEGRSHQAPQLEPLWAGQLLNIICIPNLQGAFRQLTAEADACAKELPQILNQQSVCMLKPMQTNVEGPFSLRQKSVCKPKSVQMNVQGAFRQVAVEADACAKELTQILKQRMVTQKDEAAECIQMVRKLGEPIESLQVSHPQ